MHCSATTLWHYNTVALQQYNIVTLRRYWDSEIEWNLNNLKVLTVSTKPKLSSTEG